VELSAEQVDALRNSVLYKDDWVIAIDKPAGLAVQGGTGQRRHLDAMLAAFRFDAKEAPRLVHRLDKDTGGVLLLARGAVAARGLTAAFRGKDARKVYWALVVGVPDPPRGLIDLPLAKRALRGTEKVGAAPTGKAALSLYQVVETRALGKSQPRLSWLVLVPLTGRTHQLRAHCAALGTPIVGDGKYGGRAAFPETLAVRLGRERAGMLMLHAREIAIPHPEDGTTLRASAPLAAHMAAAWAALDFDARKAEKALRELLSYGEGLAHSPPGTRPRPRAKPSRKRRTRK